MENSKFFIFIFCLCLTSHVLAAPLGKPLLGGSFCSGKDLLDYKSSQEYVYEYETDTKLWINDVSEESKSEMELKTTVIISRLGECKFLLRLEGSSLSGESINPDSNLLQHLNDNVAVFEFNSEGEIDSEVSFASGDLPWSRNIKRGIISAFQIRSEKNLRNLDELNESQEKSAVVYETDVLGRCRTTYKLDDDNYVSGKSLRLIKKKSLHACSSNYVRRGFTNQMPYRNQPEFANGRFFIEKFECRSYVKDNVLDEIDCSELSTFKLSSKGFKGIQVIAKQSLKLKFVNQAMSRVNYVPEKFDKQSISYEFSESKDNSEYKNFDSSAFLDDICKNVKVEGLNHHHSSDFKKLSDSLETKSADELVALYENAKSKCELAGATFSEALVFTNTENSFNAALSLLDKDAYNNREFLIKQSEYPLLTFLARLHNPTVDLINKLNVYLSSKTESFQYLKKMYLIYSTLVSAHCRQNGCSEENLKKWSSLFGQNLGSNCADSGKQGLVTVSLKAIGNIGNFENIKTLTNCAQNKENSLQVRVSAIESLRRFPCETTDELKDISAILRDTEEDTELRISSFLILIKCIDSKRFEKAASTQLVSFLENETDLQLLTFIIDYAKEHGLTGLLNPILSNPKIKEHFTVNFKELSWNRYRYRYSLDKDGGLETEASMIYTSNSAVPRSIRFNITSHMLGSSVNFLDATLRLEGVSDYLKGRFIDKLPTEEILKKIMDKPEKVLEILQIVASKLKFTAEKPHISFSIRNYNCEIYYVELKDIEDLSKFAEFLRNPRDNSLYRKAEYIKNAVFLDNRIRKSLLNGLEINAIIEVSASAYSAKDSNKVDSDSKREFDINNFFSLSLAVTRKYQVLINKDNRLSLKKHAFLNSKFKLDVSGTKEKSDVKKFTYNLEVAPSDRTLLVIDGKFYKMGKNSEYKEITQFTVEQYTFDKCTSEKHNSAFGIEWCLKFNRPLIGSLAEALKPINLDEVIANQELDDDDDDDDDEDDNDLVKRPRLSLSGPYHYEVKYKNPEKTKTVTLDIEVTKDPKEGTYDLVGSLQTKSQSGSVKNRLELVYSRKRTNTNRGFIRDANLEIRIPGTNDVRFKLAGNVIYKKQELVESNFVIDNKIYKKYLMTSTLLREKSSENIIPKYLLESEYYSEAREDARSFKLRIEPEGRDIKSVLSLEYKNAKTNQIATKLVDMQATLISNKNSEESGVDYKVDLTYKTAKQTTASITGDLVANMFKSNIDLNVNFASKYFTLASPANIKVGHSYDGSKGAKSYVELAVKVPSTPINHGIKTLIGLGEGFAVQHLEFQINTPSTNGKPYIVSAGKTTSTEAELSVTEVNILLENFKIDLSTRTSPIAKALIKVDGDNILNKFQIKLIREKSQDGTTNGISLELEKNNKDMAQLSLKTNGKIDIAKIAINSKEIPRQQAKATVDLKVLEYAGSMEGSFSLEKSSDKNLHVAEFEFKTDNILKFLSKISNVNVKFEKRGDSFKGNFELVRLGDLRSLKIISTSGIRKNGDWNEVNVAYEKNMANGDKKSAAGVLKYILKDYLNNQFKLDIEKVYRFDFQVQNENGNRMVRFNRAHLDFQPIESDYKIQIERKSEGDLSFLNFNIDAKRGAPNTLSDTANLDLFLNGMLKNAKLTTNGIETTVSRDIDLKFKLKAFKIDLAAKSNRNMDLKTKLVTMKAQTDFTFPNIKNPGEIADWKSNLELTRNSNKDLNLNYKANTLGKSFKIDVSTTGAKKIKLSVKQDLIKTYSSKILKQEIGVSDCTVETSFDRVKNKESGKYLLDVSLSGKCDEKVLGEGVIYISRTYPENLESWPLFSFLTSNIKLSHTRLNVEKRFLELNLDKSNLKKSGLFVINAELGEKKAYNSISYEREVDASTQKLAKGSYKMATSFGPKASKVCELKIEKSSSYYNTLNCKVISSMFPETSFGYALKSDKDKASGKKNLQLDVNIPGRTIHVDYSRSKELVDLNDGREYEATAKVFLDYSNNKERFVTITIKRDQIAPGNTKFNLVAVNNPLLTLKQFGFELERKRKLNETELKTDLSYELVNGKKNSLTSTIVLASDFVSNSISSELNLDRPAFNTLYENKFNKNTGKLTAMSLRLGQLLRFHVCKHNPEKRKISFEFANPDPSKYSVESVKTLENGVYVVKSTLKANNDILSNMKSSFDSNSNLFNVKINPVKSSSDREYTFDFGVFNESYANAIIYETNKDSKTILGTASLKVVKDNGHNDLVLNMKWNRLWSKIKGDILNEPSVPENEKYNSYFGDVYGVLSDDLKPAVENVRKARKGVREDLKKLGFLLVDFYSNIAPSLKVLMIQPKNIEPEEEVAPLYKRVFARYNKLAQTLEDLNLRVRAVSKRLSKYVPRLPVLTYNPDRLTKNIAPFSNDLEVKRPTLNAHNLYQFSAEYRDYLRKAGQNLLNVKNSLIRNLEGYGIKGLINKYKYRPLSSYTMVGHVYNRRNVIFFNGESTTLKSKCKYLLAHELRKNQFSVILNQNDSPYILSVSSYGKDPIDISYDKASINGKEISLPYAAENDKVNVIRSSNGVCLNVNKDLNVCCNRDSKSCTVSLTRWYTGKVNGLLGKTNYKRDNGDEDRWYLEASCKIPNLKLKDPSEEAKNTCHQIFGKHRKSVFRSALTVIDAVNDGWKQMCESVLTANPSGKCELMRAFAYHAKVKSIDVDVPNECYQCKVNDKSYQIGDQLPKSDSPISVSDWVFILLPCDKNKYSLDELNSIQKQFQAKFPANKQYFIKVKGDDASFIQSESSEMVNLDYKYAFSSFLKTDSVDTKGLYKALFMAGSIFAESGRISMRQVVIVSCGNCVPISFSGLPSRKLEKMLVKHNVFVSSWGEYEMVDKENESDEEKPIGYANDNVVLYKESDKSVDVDDLQSYKVEYKSDLCSRLADKTKGAVFNINYIRKANINNQIISKLMKTYPSYAASKATCERVDTSLGDGTDVFFKRVLVKNE